MTNKKIEEEIKKLVIARLKRMPPNYKFAIGTSGVFSREEIISCVEEGNKIGERIIKMHLNYIRSFKKNVE